MRISYLLCLLALITAGIMFGCSDQPFEVDYQKEIMVFGYLWADDSLNAEHGILVSYSQPVSKFYDLQQAVIRGADVTLSAENSGANYKLHDSDQKPGFYFNEDVMIQPEETYHLSIRTNGKTVTAATIVPPLLRITTDLNSDNINVVQQSGLSKRNPIFIESKNLDQIVLVDIYCNESYQNAYYIEPFFGVEKPNSQEAYDGGTDSEPRHIQAFARLKEMVSDDFPGHYVIDWYSSMIVFYGSNTMQILAIDDNYHKFIYTEHPLYNGGIHGGLGVFGSVCGKIFELQVER